MATGTGKTARADELPRTHGRLPAEKVRPFRVETWDRGPETFFLVMARGPVDVGAWVLAHNQATGEMRFGHGRLPLSARYPALQADRDAVADGVALERARPMHLRLYGLPGKPGMELPQRVYHALTNGIVRHQGQIITQAPARNTDWRGIGDQLRGDGPAALEPARLGYADPREARLTFEPGNRITLLPPSAYDNPSPGAVRGFGEAGAVLGQGEILDRIARTIQEGFEPIRSRFAPEIVELVGHSHWTPRAHAFYAAAGRVGERRRQAARLYPAFAPLFAANAVLAEQIDKGIPFEDMLRDVAGALIPPARGGGLTVAALRRFRALAGDIPFGDLCLSLELAARLPVDWLPRTGLDWEGFRSAARQVKAYADPLGLDPVDLLRPIAGQWIRFTAHWREEEAPDDDLGDPNLIQALRQARDVQRRFHDTLVEPLAQHARGGEGRQRLSVDTTDALYAVAGRMLFGGKSAYGVAKAAERWHARLNQFEASLPRQEGTTTWPALVEPLRLEHGIVVVPLTSVGELAWEGSAAPDPNGVPGLNHCVGGYGRQCYSGESHILSVRREDDGRYERLSTVELEPTRQEEGAYAPRFQVAQHHARGNTRPAAEAVAAVESLLEAIEAGAVEVNPEALQQRDAALFDDLYDWRDAENLERAFAAWAPFLSAEAAEGGLQGLRERIAPIVGADDPVPKGTCRFL